MRLYSCTYIIISAIYDKFLLVEFIKTPWRTPPYLPLKLYNLIPKAIL